MKKTLLALSLGLAFSTTAMTTQDFRFVIHGCVGYIVEGRFTVEEEKADHKGLQAAMKAGYDVLAQGDTSVDAVLLSIK